MAALALVGMRAAIIGGACATSSEAFMSDKTRTDDETKSTTQSTGFQQDGAGDKANPGNSQEEKDERLDEALEETFPSSDPVSVKITK